MAGDFSITSVSSVFPTDIRPEQSGIQETVRAARQAGLEKAAETSDDETDVSEERRKSLSDAIAEARIEPSGKLVIERDADTGKYVQKVIDPYSGEVLKQWPEEQFLELAKQMGEAYGLMVDRKV